MSDVVGGACLCTQMRFQRQCAQQAGVRQAVQAHECTTSAQQAGVGQAVCTTSASARSKQAQDKQKAVAVWRAAWPPCPTACGAAWAR
eukprot:scaffold132144_cov24-Tisochrysis_lutea.AAC.1